MHPTNPYEVEPRRYPDEGKHDVVCSARISESCTGQGTTHIRDLEWACAACAPVLGLADAAEQRRRADEREQQHATTRNIQTWEEQPR